MKIAVGSDHRGFPLKGKIVQFLRQKGFEVSDLGTHHEAPPCDYPDIAAKVARHVTERSFDRGLIVCGTGIGVSIAANKIPGIRAARCVTKRDAMLSRAHNDANVLALDGTAISLKKTKDIVLTWLRTQFEGGRHLRRVKKISKLEKDSCKR